MSRPTRLNGALRSLATRIKTAKASSFCGAETTGTPGLMMPAFSPHQSQGIPNTAM